MLKVTQKILGFSLSRLPRCGVDAKAEEKRKQGTEGGGGKSRAKRLSW